MDKNFDFQGKDKRQVEDSYSFAAIGFVGLIFIFGYLIIKNFIS